MCCFLRGSVWTEIIFFLSFFRRTQKCCVVLCSGSVFDVRNQETQRKTILPFSAYSSVICLVSPDLNDLLSASFKNEVVLCSFPNWCFSRCLAPAFPFFFFFFATCRGTQTSWTCSWRPSATRTTQIRYVNGIGVRHRVQNLVAVLERFVLQHT